MRAKNECKCSPRGRIVKSDQSELNLRVALEQTKDIVVVVSILSHRSTRQPTRAATSFRKCLLVLQEPNDSCRVNVKKQTSDILGLDSRNSRYDSFRETTNIELEEFRMDSVSLHFHVWMFSKFWNCILGEHPSMKME